MKSQEDHKGHLLGQKITAVELNEPESLHAQAKVSGSRLKSTEDPKSH